MKKKATKAAPKKILSKKPTKLTVAKSKKHPAKKTAQPKKATLVKNSSPNKPVKRKPVSIRMLTTDIEAIKTKAAKLGVPYQTYINIIIHREAVSA